MSDTPRKVARWTAADIAPAEHGGFVTYGDFLTLAEELARLQEKLSRLPADWEVDSSLETWFPFSAEELARLRSELAQAESKIYVPGEWSCAKCKLSLTASVLSPGGVAADTRPQQCPNKCGPMWRVTERDRRKEAQALFSQEFDRRQQAEAERDRLREDVEGLKRAYSIVQQDCHNLTEKVIPNIREQAEAKLAAARRELAQVEAERNGLRKGVETAENIARRAEHRANQLESDMAAARSEGWAAGMQRAITIGDDLFSGEVVSKHISSRECLVARDALSKYIDAIRAEIAKGPK